MITAMILTTTLCAVNADNRYTIKDYIANYYSEIYREGADAAFDKITIQDTNRKNELWVLTGNLSQYNIFNNKIEKVENPYVIQRRKDIILHCKAQRATICIFA